MTAIMQDEGEEEKGKEKEKELRKAYCRATCASPHWFYGTVKAIMP